jgi:hypothetical protein
VRGHRRGVAVVRLRLDQKNGGSAAWSVSAVPGRRAVCRPPSYLLQLAAAAAAGGEKRAAVGRARGCSEQRAQQRGARLRSHPGRRFALKVAPCAPVDPKRNAGRRAHGSRSVRY